MNTHAAPDRVKSEVSDLPIARIEAQDISLSLPLREYLEQNGCAVVLNRKPAIAPTYHLVIGDEEYVKETVARAEKNQIEMYAIILLPEGTRAKGDVSKIHAKIAVISPSMYSTREAGALFAYFFTGSEHVYYATQHQSTTKEHREVSAPPELSFDRTPGALAMHEVRMAPLQEKITRAMDDLFPSTDRESVQQLVPPLPPAVPPSLVKYLVMVFIGLIVLPVVWYGIALASVGVSQYRLMQGINKGDASAIEKSALQTRYWAGQGTRTLGFMSMALESIGLTEVMRNQERIVGIARELAEAELHTARLIRESIASVPFFFTSGALPASQPILVVVERMRNNLDELSSSLGLASAQLELLTESNTFPMSVLIKKNTTMLARRVIQQVRDQVSRAESALSLYRVAGGFDGKKTYLIVFQNSMELRPTGGFIGSIATVAIEDGRIEPPNIQDVYAIDGQLKGHVDPPRPIKELLNQEHWYLRDSNWDPDFAKSGEKIAWFYEKETGETVDGVIAVSTPALLELLGALGPVTLPDYNDRISKDNFFGKSLFYTQADFFPGSTQKKDFLSSLTSALLSRLASIRPEEGKDVMLGVGRSLAGGDLQFWFADNQGEALAQQAGWAGTLAASSACKYMDRSCVALPLAIIESNMGVNKVNAYVKRAIKNRVDIDASGIIDGTVSVTYQNTSTDDAALSGGGVYLSYVRAYLPFDAVIVSATLDGQEMPMRSPKTVSPSLPYRDLDETTADQSIVSLAFTVPSLMSRTIAIRYQLGGVLDLSGGEAVFVHSLRKQAGVTDTDMGLVIGYPSTWTAHTNVDADTATDIGFLANAKEVRYNTTLDQTKEVTIRFRK